MLKRFKVWAFLAAAMGATVLESCGGWWPLGGDVNSPARIIYQILREELFG
jgi:hypothetical protein